MNDQRAKNELNDSIREKYSDMNNGIPAQKKKIIKILKRSRSPSDVSNEDNLGEFKAEISAHDFSSLGGLDKVLSSIKELVERPMRNADIYRYLGIDPPKGILLYGPPGCGKTCLAYAISGELSVPMIRISAPEMVSGVSGESEGKIRDLFTAAQAQAPCILFIDEIDAITPKRDNVQKEMEKRIVAQLLTCLDEVSADFDKHVVVIGATSRPDVIDPALRRAGRFDHEIKVGIPSENDRIGILSVLTRRVKLHENVSLGHIARRTPGYVGADLKSLVREASSQAINRIMGNSVDISLEAFHDTCLIQKDFDYAFARIQPSAKREGFAIVPNVSWEDIGALSGVREELRMAVVEPIRNPDLFVHFGLSSPCGVLLWGPPGCGKTLLAKAVANETHSNFISVKGPELLNKYVGESERGVRQVFERARASSPCVIFFDELDSICPRRSNDSDSSSARVVNQLLTELDGLEGRKDVYVIAATNRPDMIDPAMMRPGRLDKLLFVGLPIAEERYEILKAISKKVPWSGDISLKDIAFDRRCEGMSGADLSALVRECALGAIRDHLREGKTQVEPCAKQICISHVENAFSRITLSVSPSERKSYDVLREKMVNK